MELTYAFTAISIAVAVGAILRMRSTAAPQPHTAPTSPLDSAEQILASRYARGRISPEEYERMTAILRR